METYHKYLPRGLYLVPAWREENGRFEPVMADGCQSQHVSYEDDIVGMVTYSRRHGWRASVDGITIAHDHCDSPTFAAMAFNWCARGWRPCVEYGDVVWRQADSMPVVGETITGA